MAGEAGEELPDEQAHDAVEHALADARDASADIGAIVVGELRGGLAGGSKGDEGLAHAEAELAVSAAGDADRARLVLVGELDLRVIGGAHAGDRKDDLGLEPVRLDLGEGAAAGNDLRQFVDGEKRGPYPGRLARQLLGAFAGKHAAYGGIAGRCLYLPFRAFVGIASVELRPQA